MGSQNKIIQVNIHKSTIRDGDYHRDIFLIMQNYSQYLKAEEYHSAERSDSAIGKIHL